MQVGEPLDSWVDTAAGDTSWSQTTTAAVTNAGTAVTINDTAPTADRYNLAAVEILAKPTGGDTQPPVVSMTAPAAGATVSGSAVTVSANATDNVAVASVQFLLDGSALGGPDTAAPYQISWDSTKVANGSHQLSALATDTSGNQATSTAVSVTVSNTVTPPTGLAVDTQVSVHGKGPVTTPAFSTKAGDWLVAYGSSDGPGPGQTLTVSGAGLTWSLVKRANAQAVPLSVGGAGGFGLVGCDGVGVSGLVGLRRGLDGGGVFGFVGGRGVGGGRVGSGAPSVSLTTTAAGSLVAGAGMDWITHGEDVGCGSGLAGFVGGHHGG